MLYATEFTAAVYITATAEDVRKGKRFVNSAGVLTEGTMGEPLPEESSSVLAFAASSLTLFGRTTADPEDVREGKVFVDRTGTLVTGTYSESSSSQSFSIGESSSSILSGITIYCDDIQNPPVIYYRIVQNGVRGEWILYTFGTELDVSSRRIELKGEYWGDYENPCHFVITGSVNSGGDIRSLTGRTIKHTGYLKGLFKNNPALKSAPRVPYTELKEECFKEMFYNTGITEAPHLPAMELVRDCYAYMFYNDKSLRKVSVGFTDWGDYSNSTPYGTAQWLCGEVAESGIFTAPVSLPKICDCEHDPWCTYDSSSVQSSSSSTPTESSSSVVPGESSSTQSSSSIESSSSNQSSSVESSSAQESSSIQSSSTVESSSSIQSSSSSTQSSSSSSSAVDSSSAGSSSSSESISDFAYMWYRKVNKETGEADVWRPYASNDVIDITTEDVQFYGRYSARFKCSGEPCGYYAEASTSYIPAPAAEWTNFLTFSSTKRPNVTQTDVYIDAVTAEKSTVQLKYPVYSTTEHAHFSMTGAVYAYGSLGSIVSNSAPVLSSMFAGCDSLYRAPGISFGVIPAYGCSNTFNGCTHLKVAAVSGQSTFGSCNDMFRGCDSLMYIAASISGAGDSCKNPINYEWITSKAGIAVIPRADRKSYRIPWNERKIAYVGYVLPEDAPGVKSAKDLTPAMLEVALAKGTLVCAVNTFEQIPTFPKTFYAPAGSFVVCLLSRIGASPYGAFIREPVLSDSTTTRYRSFRENNGNFGSGVADYDIYLPGFPSIEGLIYTPDTVKSRPPKDYDPVGPWYRLYGEPALVSGKVTVVMALGPWGFTLDLSDFNPPLSYDIPGYQHYSCFRELFYITFKAQKTCTISLKPLGTPWNLRIQDSAVGSEESDYLIIDQEYQMNMNPGDVRSIHAYVDCSSVMYMSLDFLEELGDFYPDPINAMAIGWAENHNPGSYPYFGPQYPLIEEESSSSAQSLSSSSSSTHEYDPCAGPCCYPEPESSSSYSSSSSSGADRTREEIFKDRWNENNHWIVSCETPAAFTVTGNTRLFEIPQAQYVRRREDQMAAYQKNRVLTWGVDVCNWPVGRFATYGLFHGCAGLVSSDILLATSPHPSDIYRAASALGAPSYGYKEFYADCPELRSVAPIYEHRNIDGIYDSLFANSPKFDRLTVKFCSWHDPVPGSLERSATRNWLCGAKSLGYFTFDLLCLPVIYDCSHIPEGWYSCEFAGANLTYSAKKDFDRNCTNPVLHNGRLCSRRILLGGYDVPVETSEFSQYINAVQSICNGYRKPWDIPRSSYSVVYSVDYMPTEEYVCGSFILDAIIFLSTTALKPGCTIEGDEGYWMCSCISVLSKAPTFDRLLSSCPVTCPSEAPDCMNTLQEYCDGYYADNYSLGYVIQYLPCPVDTSSTADTNEN